MTLKDFHFMRKAMIKILNISKEEPYKIFRRYFDKALKAKQKNIEAISVSSFNKENNEVESRYVNLKYLIEDEWIFFSNFKSRKALDFKGHDQVSVLFHWSNIDTQIRMKAKIKKASSKISDEHFLNRDIKKNALAISSNQSQEINSYSDVIKNYELTLKNINNESRPSFWGGYSFTPYYFEFWEGHESRINKRMSFTLNNLVWNKKILQP